MYRIGVDLGGTNISAGLIKNKSIIKTMSIPTNSGRKGDEIVKDIADLCRRLTDGEKISDIELIGIGSPGIVDMKNGVVKNAVNVSHDDICIKAVMAKYFDIPVFVGNDADCAAVGEAVCGASAGTDNSVMITLGTGVGGGIIVNGKLFSGSAGGGGEVGHMSICADGGVVCKCGRVGCFEQYASTSALIRMMKEADDDNENIDGKYIFAQARLGNETALSVLDKYKFYLSEGIANLINIFQPEVLVVGGGISAQGEYLLADVRNAVARKILTKNPNITRIVKAQLENDAGIIGAAFIKDFT